jgi:serine/threonine protein kinase
MNAVRCPKCGAEIPPDSPADFCPRCLLATGLESDVDSVAGAQVTTPHSGSGRRFVPPTAAELADRFPQLEILGLVGAGGMGAVYKARQRELDRTVALKILPPQLGEDPAFAERFLREARAMARLSHPNIVAIFDFGRAGDLCYFTMEFVDGTNLRQVIKTEKVESSDALSIAVQICDALQYAHEEGVVHRDIKPENILVSRLGRVKITDFGLAKVVFDAAQASALTGTAELLGTYRYMAPEQLEQSSRRKVDHRADIYALGIVLYELLTGEVPMGRFHPPSEKSKSDPRLDEIVFRALEREPERRYQRASEIRTALESIDSTAGGYSDTSALSSRWTSGMFSGVWSATTSRPASAWVVAVRLLGMLVAFSGVMTACFMTWDAVRIELIETPANWSSYQTTIADQSSLGWQTQSGRIVAIAFVLILLHLLTNLHRLRWLRPTIAAFFVCGFAAIAISAWSMARDPALSGAPIRWQIDQWQEFRRNNESPQGTVATSPTPRAYLESLGSESPSPTDTSTQGLGDVELVEQLVKQGRVSLSSSWADGPYAGLALGIGLAFVGLLEFIFTYAAEPTRRILGTARSSVASRFSGRLAMAEPRISKMAVAAALLGVLPIIPIVFLGMMAIRSVGSAGVDEETVVIAIAFLIGLSIFPTTVGLFAMYRIRRSRGMLHGLPLAFAASLTWPLVIADVLVFAVGIAVTPTGAHEGAALSALTIALILNVLAFVFAWGAITKPL